MSRVLLAGLWAALALPLGCQDAVEGPLMTGIWGGEGIHLDVSSTGAEAEFDCAAGSLPGPIHVDGAGRFELSGTYTLGQGGPVREDEVPDVRPARFIGHVTGTRLDLRIELESQDSPLGLMFQLRWGESGRLRKCL